MTGLAKSSHHLTDMLLGYHSNGLAHHRASDGLEMLASIGFTSVAFSIDHGWLSPLDSDHLVTIQAVRSALSRNQLSCTVEVDAPFLLDSYRRHEPTLVDANPEIADRRGDLIRYAIDTAVELGSHCVSIPSGPRPAGLAFSTALDLLVERLRPILDYAAERDVWLALEPTPAMLIDHTGRFERLLHLLDSDQLRLTLDVGQLFCMSELPISGVLERWRDRLVNVHLCDARVGHDEHLALGEGQLHVRPILESLLAMDYRYGVHVEVEHSSRDAARVARHSYDQLSAGMIEAKQAWEGA